MSGHSKLRNRTIANIFNQMGFVEAWGTGIRRIKEAAKSYGLPTPEILVFDDMFRVNLYRNKPWMFSEDECYLQDNSYNSGNTEKDLKKFGESTEEVRRKFGGRLEKVRR